MDSCQDSVSQILYYFVQGGLGLRDSPNLIVVAIVAAAIVVVATDEIVYHGNPVCRQGL